MSQYLDTVYEAILAGVEEDTLAALLANWDCLDQDEKRFVKVLRAASSGGGGAGDIVGPGSSTNNAVALWDGVGGDTLKDSNIKSSDGNDLEVPGVLKVGGTGVQANLNPTGLTVDQTFTFPDTGGVLGVKVDVPATAASAGEVGTWAADTDNLYICIATNTWKRVDLSTF